MLKSNLLNLVLFQAGWWATLLTAYHNTSLTVLFVGIAILIAIQFKYVVPAKRRARETLFCIGLACFGFLFDSIFYFVGILEFTSSMGLLAPLWLMGMWLLFPMTIGYSFAWLNKKYALAGVLGAIGGPITYKVGAAFDLVDINGLASLLIYALYWAAIFIASVFTYNIWVRTKDNV
jgi:hypothetical protein